MKKKELIRFNETSPRFRRFIKIFTAIHNFGLMVFSMICTVRFNKLLNVRNLFFIDPRFLETNRYYGDPLISLMWAFTFSKIWEFTDTWVTQIKGKGTNFLQIFHHAGAIFCWFIASYYRSPIILVPSYYNSIVHSIMYGYYFVSTLKLFKLRFARPVITTIQLSQLIGGAIITFYHYYKSHDMGKLLTEQSGLILITLNVYNSILIVLFLQFYYLNYFRPSRKKTDGLKDLKNE